LLVRIGTIETAKRIKAKHSSLFHLIVSDEKEKFHDIVTCGQFHKHFTLVTYGPCKISWTIIRCLHVPMQYFQNGPAYFATTVSYTHKMFKKIMTLSPVGNFINILTMYLTALAKKLNCHLLHTCSHTVF
jgi:hypothetical protein